MTIRESKVNLDKKSRIDLDFDKIPFGRIFTDHMLLMKYKESEGGWSDPKIKPFGNLSLSPAASVLHYGQEIFEGLKAYRSPQGDIQLFRPKLNIKRMNTSAERLCMPTLDVDVVLRGLKRLIKTDAKWVPATKGASLYIRPTMIATEPFLGVQSGKEYLFYVIMSPVGFYFKDGFKPLRILVENQYVRACDGGVGSAKTGGNYARSLKCTKSAKERGYAEVLWLDAHDRKYISEVGAMNIGFIIDGKFVTPPLDGTILEGITRNSIIALLKYLDMEIEERPISIEEVITAIHENRLLECFGMGTAAVVAPVGSLHYNNTTYIINQNQVGVCTEKIYRTLTQIQYGIHEDIFGWIEKV